MLASAVIENMKSEEPQKPHAPRRVYYFFFDCKSPISNLASSAYRAILTQAFWNNPNSPDMDLADRFAFIMESRKQGQQDIPESVLKDLLVMCLAGQVILVLDGIDECSDKESFVEFILALSQQCPDVRILLSSRINIGRLNRSILPELQLVLGKDSVSQDIRAYCERELLALFQEGILPSTAFGSRQGMVERLTQGADGMFLWIRLLMSFLRSPSLTSRRRLEVIRSVNLPEGLERMYRRIIDLILQSGQSSSRLAFKVLLWASYSVVPLSSRQVQGAVAADEDTDSVVESEVEPVSEFEDAVIMACSGLVERRAMTNSSFHRPGTLGLFLIHLSIQEYLQCQLHSIGIPFLTLLANHEAANIQLANSCLRQFLYHTTLRPPAGITTRGSLNEPKKDMSFADYAAISWFLHLGFANRQALEPSLFDLPHIADTTAKVALNTALSAFGRTLMVFLQSPSVLSTWLEAFFRARWYRIGSLQYNRPPAHLLLSWAASTSTIRVDGNQTLPSELAKTIERFVADLQGVMDTWGTRLDENPEIIWDEMSAMSKSSFFFSPGGTQISYQDAKAPSSGMRGLRKCVTLMSRTSDDGELKGILSIWALA